MAHSGAEYSTPITRANGSSRAASNTRPLPAPMSMKVRPGGNCSDRNRVRSGAAGEGW
jgi:hypothetical protein